MGLLTDRRELTTAPEPDDLIHIVSVADNTDSPQGSSMKIKISTLFSGIAQAIADVYTALAGKANTVHSHDATDVTDLQTAVSSNTDVLANTTARHTHSNKTILDAIQEAFTTSLKTAYDTASSWVTTNGANVLAHLVNTSNPHSVTKAQVGLGNADNTSDASKPISTATQTALNAKANTLALAPVATSGAYNDLTGKPDLSVYDPSNIFIDEFARVTLKQYTPTTIYYKLAELPVDNSGNYCSLILAGRMGGWKTDEQAYFTVMMTNRGPSGLYTGDIVGAAVQVVGEWKKALTLTDIVVYKQADKSAIVYLKISNYFAYDFSYNTMQSVAAYSTTPVTPVGDLLWNLSTAPKLAVEQSGTLTVTDGLLSVGVSAPTASVHVKAGTATAGTAPIKLTAGTSNTTPEAGAIEYDGTDFYMTIA